MYSRDHALISLAVGAGVVLVTRPESPLVAGAVVLVAVGLGVGIDFDHFVIARLNHGDWKNLRRVLRRPRIVIAEQEAIFDEGDLRSDQRLLSHAVIGGVLVAALWPVSRYWAGVVAVTVYAHVLADLYQDVRNRDGRPGVTPPSTRESAGK